MKVFKPERDVMRSTLIYQFLLFLLISLFILAQPLPSSAQETQSPELLQMQPFSENTPRRSRRAEIIRNANDLARSVRFIYVRSQSALVTTEDIV
jgi:hypothetical protein